MPEVQTSENHGNNANMVMRDQISIQNLILKLFHFPRKYHNVTSHQLIAKKELTAPEQFKVKIMDINSARKKYQKYVYFQLFFIFATLISLLFQFNSILARFLFLLLFIAIFMNWLIIAVKSEQYKREEEIEAMHDNYILTEHKKLNTLFDKFNFMIEPFCQYYITVELRNIHTDERKYLHIASQLAYHELLTNLHLRYEFLHIHSS
ncbi:hypothetical protein MLC35_00950 [Sulfurimonas sp. NW7]|uniref:hypothetical protein n=1 Tax=Sulfurimonas sp. NW7 TaxID=2922727 RepID=UPI003DAA3D7B